MDIATLTFLVAVITGAIKLAPEVVNLIDKWDGPEETKEQLKARIKAAQDSLPEWV